MSITNKKTSTIGTNKRTRESISPQHAAAKQSRDDTSPITKQRKTDQIQNPEYIIIKSEDTTFEHISPFAIHRAFQNLGVRTKQVRKQKDGSIFVQVSDTQEAPKLLSATSLAGLKIKAVPHATLNSSKGVITTPEFRGLSDETLSEELQPSGVLEARRIVTRRDGKPFATNSIVLTFNTPIPPQTIYGAYLVLTVRPYIPQPLRCYICQKFGHTKNRCRGKPTCVNCGEQDHSENCTNASTCINCKDDHPANSKLCPMWLQEKLVNEIKYTRHMTFPEARKLARHQYAVTNKPYSEVVKGKVMVSVSTQTDASTQTEPDLLKPQKSTQPQNKQTAKSQNQTPTNTKTKTTVSKNSQMPPPLPKRPPPVPRKPASTGLHKPRDQTPTKQKGNSKTVRLSYPPDNTVYENVSDQEQQLSQTSLSIANTHNKTRPKDSNLGV